MESVRLSWADKSLQYITKLRVPGFSLFCSLMTSGIKMPLKYLGVQKIVINKLVYLCEFPIDNSKFIKWLGGLVANIQ